ncbi:unnamed protein product [Lactuca saligna]|uniref:Uncharacterized protein n=1 Tax=Lactuca saligna TaxID=75948 RepID=A0AA35VC60_LACSI|nr:unnamed protein product [Lactuca saligna]
MEDFRGVPVALKCKTLVGFHGILVTLDDDQQGVHFYQELVAQGVIEEDHEENPNGGPAMGQQVGPEVEPEEYVVTDYECDEFDQELDEGKEVDEARNEPHLSKAPINPHTV